MCAPNARRPSVTASIRSVSFTRSSAAPRTTLLPRACEASSATSGSSSTRSGTSSAVDLDRAELARTAICTSPTGSRPALRRLKIAMRAPMRSSTSRKPVRRGFRLDVVDREVAARHERGRGEQRRGRRDVAGNVDLAEPERRRGLDRHRRRPPPRRARRRSRASARCGRASAPARRRSSGPSALSPASSTADFTCALATGSS